MSQKLPDKQRSGILGLFQIVTVFALIMSIGHFISSKRNAPDTSVRIAATLVSWGLNTDGLSIDISSDDIDRNIALLRSPDGEARVQAADWLASRGLHDSGSQIAIAMADEGTLRPCQLAHSLGQLGDEQWIETLLVAAKQPRNKDLRACASLALCDIASPSSVDALIDLCRSESSRKVIIQALGKISDPSALKFLRSVALSPNDEIENEIAIRAIERIELMQQVDPIPQLIERLKKFDQRNRLEIWAVRVIARLQDARAVPALQDIMLNPSINSNDSIVVAAGLLTFGETGVAALQQIVESHPKSYGSITAKAALSLIDNINGVPTLARR